MYFIQINVKRQRVPYSELQWLKGEFKTINNQNLKLAIIVKDKINGLLTSI